MTAPRVDRDRIYAERRSRLGVIRRELYRGFFHQALWEQFRDEYVRRHPAADATFLVSYTQLYVAGQMMLVRRLVDNDDASHSLASLIRAISRNPTVVTRSRYVRNNIDRMGEERRGDAEREWDRAFAGSSDPELVSADVLAEHVLRLRNELEAIVAWATKVIAHLGSSRPQRIPLYSEIREALTLLAEITNHYELLLDQSTTAEWTPVMQGDWQEPFRPSLFPLDPSAWGWPAPGGYS